MSLEPLLLPLCNPPNTSKIHNVLSQRLPDLDGKAILSSLSRWSPKVGVAIILGYDYFVSWINSKQNFIMTASMRHTFISQMSKQLSVLPAEHFHFCLPEISKLIPLYFHTLFTKPTNFSSITNHEPDLKESPLYISKSSPKIWNGSIDLVSAIPFLKTIIHKCQKNSSELTTVHLYLLKSYWNLGLYYQAIEWLNTNFITNIPSGPLLKYNFSVKDVMDYFYTCGNIYLQENRYFQALLQFESVLLLPADTLSPIALASIKRYILLCLIVKKRYSPLPRLYSTIVENDCMIYTDFSTLFSSGCVAALDCISSTFSQTAFQRVVGLLHNSQNTPLRKKVVVRGLTITRPTWSIYQGLSSFIKSHSTTFAADGLDHLAQTVLEYYFLHNLNQLTKSYQTLKIDTVVSCCGFSNGKEAIQYIFQFCRQHLFSAQIDMVKQLVYFQESSLETKVLKDFKKISARSKSLEKSLVESRLSIVQHRKFRNTIDSSSTNP